MKPHFTHSSFPVSTPRLTTAQNHFTMPQSSPLARQSTWEAVDTIIQTVDPNTFHIVPDEQSFKITMSSPTRLEGIKFLEALLTLQ
jgi:hypothetical protein